MRGIFQQGVKVALLQSKSPAGQNWQTVAVLTQTLKPRDLEWAACPARLTKPHARHFSASCKSRAPSKLARRVGRGP
jgi:hypothetical protein